MTKPTGCPVERERSDSEKILKWLNHKTIQKGETRWWHDRKQRWLRAEEFNFLESEQGPADASLDYLVLEKVRRLDEEVIECFENHLHAIYMNRWVHEEKPETPTTLLLHILFHLPGDYAEAARFLWEPTP